MRLGCVQNATEDTVRLAIALLPRKMPRESLGDVPECAFIQALTHLPGTWGGFRTASRRSTEVDSAMLKSLLMVVCAAAEFVSHSYYTPAPLDVQNCC